MKLLFLRRSSYTARLFFICFLLFNSFATCFTPYCHPVWRTTSEAFAARVASPPPPCRAYFLRNQHSMMLFSKPNGESEGGEDSFYIRKALYSDLNDVSDIIMSSFYSGNNLKMPWRQLFRLGELNRLQQNFPYSDAKHCMFVACTRSSSNNEEEIVAFVDVDARPPRQRQDPPRPYLSDLCVSTNYRRRGIAKLLVQKCEQVALNQMSKNELYIRVEQNNSKAINMYQGLQYSRREHNYFGVIDSTMLLHKRLVTETVVDDSSVRNDGSNTNRTQQETVLDYIL